MTLLRALRNSAAFYPMTVFWIAAVLVAAAAMRGTLTLLGVSIVLTIIGFGAAIVATYRELRAVHRILHGQRTEMLREIDKLRQLLEHHGFTPPPASSGERQARADSSAKKTDR